MAASRPTDLLPEVKAFLAGGPLPGVMGGQKAAASNGEVFVTRDPGTGEALTEVCALQPEDVDRAVRAAQEAFAKSGWAQLSPNDRGVLLHRLADAVEQRKKILAQIEALDCGKV